MQSTFAHDTIKRYSTIRADLSRDNATKEANRTINEFFNQSEAFQHFVEFYMWLQPGADHLACNRAQLRYKACELRLMNTGFFHNITMKLLPEKETDFYANFSQYLLPHFNLSKNVGEICKPLLVDDKGTDQNETDSCLLNKLFNLTDYIVEAKECIEHELFPVLNDTLIETLGHASDDYLKSLAELKSHLDEYKGKFTWTLDFYRYYYNKFFINYTLKKKNYTLFAKLFAIVNAN